jgi:uncharacterized protein
MSYPTNVVFLMACLTLLDTAVCGGADMPPEISPIGSKVSNRLSDVVQVSSPSAVHLGGWLGHRIAINEKNRLLTVEIEPMLAGFRRKPGDQAWIGEHVGKWIHASTLAWANTGDPALRAKLDLVVKELISAQEPDGYLGTYAPGQRFGLFPGADWDVWSHKYCLIGLLTYYQYTGDEPALAAARRAADLLLRTFPGKKSILAAGTHVGMAATSVLEPIVALYRLTADERYLTFARYLVKAWDEPDGPAILHSLLTVGRVDQTANGKAYEMLSNLVGLCDLARVTGERSYIEASLKAWQDIVENRLYLTGTSSEWEHFQDDHVLDNDEAAELGETCVTTTWIQFNLSLLQLTGEARFGDEIERSYYNQLTAAQSPRGEDWCYYTPLEGRKRYDHGITCCHSSGPRALALAPGAAYLRGSDAGVDVVLVNTLEDSSARLVLGGEAVTIEQRSGFPRLGQSALALRMERPARFAVKVRIPVWALPATVEGRELRAAGWAEVPARLWQNGDRIPLTFSLQARMIAGDHGNLGRAALAWGPFVLAYPTSGNPDTPVPRTIGLPESQPVAVPTDGPALAFSARLAGPGNVLRPATLVPFADAGADGGVYRIWLRAPGVSVPPNDSVLLGGREGRSRGSNQPGSIIDEDFQTFVTTSDGKLATEDWFAVTLPAAAQARRFTFAHGQTFPDGGWFDTSGGKPRIQIRRSTEGAWETIGELADYPATTSVDGPKESWVLRPGRQFTLKLPEAVPFVAVRVIGKPACGNNPSQAYTSCAEFQAFAQ